LILPASNIQYDQEKRQEKRTMQNHARVHLPARCQLFFFFSKVREVPPDETK